MSTDFVGILPKASKAVALDDEHGKASKPAAGVPVACRKKCSKRFSSMKQKLIETVDILERTENKLKSTATIEQAHLDSLVKTFDEIRAERTTAFEQIRLVSQEVEEISKYVHVDDDSPPQAKFRNIVETERRNAALKTMDTLHKREVNKIKEKMRTVFADVCNIVDC